MDCDQAHEAISASLDGELPARELAPLRTHLARCPGCRAWREDAHALARRTRLSVVGSGPAPDPALAPAGAAAGFHSPARDVTRWARAGLVAVAALQLALTIPALVLGSDRDAPMHVAHEMGSFDLALALGFLAAAWRPPRARGMATLVGVAALALVVTAVIDLAGGRTTLADEAPHLIAVAGWALLRLLAAVEPDRDARRDALRAHRRRFGDDLGEPAAEPPRVGELADGVPRDDHPAVAGGGHG